jgi:hypothetical protein
MAFLIQRKEQDASGEYHLGARLAHSIFRGALVLEAVCASMRVCHFYDKTHAFKSPPGNRSDDDCRAVAQALRALIGDSRIPR